MYVPSVNDQNQESWRLLVEERIANIAKLGTSFFWNVSIKKFLLKKKMGFGSSQTTLLGLAGGGFVAMAVDISDI